MGSKIPVIVDKPLVACGFRKFQLDAMGDHLWVVKQLVDLFLTTHKVKTQHVTKNRGRHCGDIQLAAYLVDTTGPILVRQLNPCY
jgi:hypothetical protein